MKPKKFIPFSERGFPKSVRTPHWAHGVSQIFWASSICLFLLSCSPKLSNHGPVQYQPTKSETRQRNFVILWTLATAMIIAVAVQDDLKTPTRQ